MSELENVTNSAGAYAILDLKRTCCLAKRMLARLLLSLPSIESAVSLGSFSFNLVVEPLGSIRKKVVFIGLGGLRTSSIVKWILPLNRIADKYHR